MRRQFARGLREADACCTNHSSVWCVVADRANISEAWDRSGSEVAARRIVIRSRLDGQRRELPELVLGKVALTLDPLELG